MLGDGDHWNRGFRCRTPSTERNHARLNMFELLDTYINHEHHHRSTQHKDTLTGTLLSTWLARKPVWRSKSLYKSIFMTLFLGLRQSRHGLSSLRLGTRYPKRIRSSSAQMRRVESLPHLRSPFQCRFLLDMGKLRRSATQHASAGTKLRT